MCDFATVGGICVAVAGSSRAAFCYHCAFGRHQLSPTEDKQHTLACWQFVAAWRLVCDLLVCLMCLDTVGPYCEPQSRLFWEDVSVLIGLRRFWNFPSPSIWGSHFGSCGEVLWEDICGSFHEAISLCVSVWEHKSGFWRRKYRNRVVSSSVWTGFKPQRTQFVDENWKVWWKQRGASTSTAKVPLSKVPKPQILGCALPHSNAAELGSSVCGPTRDEAKICFALQQACWIRSKSYSRIIMLIVTASS